VDGGDGGIDARAARARGPSRPPAMPVQPEAHQVALEHRPRGITGGVDDVNQRDGRRRIDAVEGEMRGIRCEERALATG